MRPPSLAGTICPTAGNRSRNFGPDAPPKNKRKPPRKDDRGPKGPIKEWPVSRLYENDEDWRDDGKDDLDDVATSAAADDVNTDDDDN